MNQIQTLLDHHFRNDYKDAVRMAGGGHKGEDVVQDAYVNALMYWDDTVKDFDHWFKVIVANCSKKVMRVERLRGMADGQANLEPAPANIFSAAMLGEVTKLINEHNHSDILNRFFLKQELVKTIEAQVPETDANIRVIIHRFRNELKKRYKGG